MKIALVGAISIAALALTGCTSTAAPAVTVTAPAETVTVEPTPTAGLLARSPDPSLFITFVRGRDNAEIAKQSDAELIVMGKAVCANLADGEEFNVAAVNAIYEKIQDPDAIALIAGAGSAVYCPEYIPDTSS